ncbi:MAG: hypothetical protein JXD18_07395, partial [Anaerolineae bacterium]|nr:hypothetical protein [Anaerolineae bacterium]
MSTWGTRRVFDALQRLSNVYYRRKYGALAQQMGRTDCRSDTGQGLIIIQIDGLSYDQFQRAITLGTMPHLTRLIAQGRLKVSSWQCGLPSTTPAVQAGIMFGCRDDIPGFRWYEKATRSAIVAKRPDQMRAVQARVRGARPGLLAGGSSYVNMFDGDADLAVFTLSAFPPGRLFEAVRGVGLFSLFLLSPFRLVRIVALTVVRYFESLLWRATALFRPMVLKPYDVISPLLGATVNTLFTEVQTFGVALDIYRQVPIIYTNYNHYDEVAHHLGPAHRSALRVLRDVDRRIGQIDRMRTLYSGRA